ncbi:unnamed protein product [Mesocestoides corti]|uniref:Mediator of RNA polymerase II transcription subunit 8 n=1 Tax=Mesocestoides corti TaxID=53468 RepID=A0A0R3U5M1_MESCO|nr:unnamed protein product [Mesocestoides corti]
MHGRLAVNSQSFNNSVIEALNRCDELETQLQGFESWIDLPIINPSDPSANFDEVSDDAQRLVDILQQVQSALLSAVSNEALKDTLPEFQSNAVLKAEYPPPLQGIVQGARPQVLQHYYQLHNPEIPELSASMESPSAAFIQEEQTANPESEASISVGARNPTIVPPASGHLVQSQHPLTPQKQSRRAYDEVSSSYNQHQAISRTGSDPNLVGQPMQMHQDALGNRHMQGSSQQNIQLPHTSSAYSFRPNPG